MEKDLNVNIILKQLKDIRIEEKMENLYLLVLAQYVEKRELQDTKDTYTIIVKLF